MPLVLKSQTALQYIEKIKEPELKRLAKKLRSIIREALPEAEETIKMGVPCYLINGKMIATIADYSKHVNLYFFKGTKLSSKILEGTGKGLRHIKISSDADIDEQEIARLLVEASLIALTA